MRAVVQRVKSAGVKVDGRDVGRISGGLLVLLGVGKDDTDKDLDYLVKKILNLRIFEDEQGKMNRSVIDVGGELLVVSQFTLYGDCRKGRRPGFDQSARPEIAEPMYEAFVEKARAKGVRTETGTFGAYMDVDLVNDGPVTFLLDSTRQF
jgi:D-aminoacyl-tRNA deacylase